MEDNSELLNLFPELRHGLFAAKIKKPMESYLHASSNDISMNALKTIVANDMENSKLGEAGFDEHDIFSPPSIEEKIFFDDTLPPIYDDYNDSGLLVPPTMESKFYYDYTMPPTLHENNNDSYIVEFVHDATESYYERGKHGYMHLNNIKFPLFMLRILKLRLCCLPMLATLFFMNLFVYKIPFHRKWVRLKCVLNLLFDVLFCFNSSFLR